MWERCGLFQEMSTAPTVAEMWWSDADYGNFTNVISAWYILHMCN